ncbi:Uncharacterised protein [Bordetella trematum]|nr:Uncharacterised protein [Bordetella trematum]VDH07581.1 Uncharacterised protein [Bordetella trematum]
MVVTRARRVLRITGTLQARYSLSTALRNWEMKVLSAAMLTLAFVIPSWADQALPAPLQDWRSDSKRTGSGWCFYSSQKSPRLSLQIKQTPATVPVLDVVEKMNNERKAAEAYFRGRGVTLNLPHLSNKLEGYWVPTSRKSLALVLSDNTPLFKVVAFEDGSDNPYTIVLAYSPPLEPGARAIPTPVEKDQMHKTVVEVLQNLEHLDHCGAS